jgi:ketosteroid isomerase-like protein
MDDMTAVRRAVDRLLAGSLGPLLDLLAEDVEFEVAGGEDVPSCRMDSGKQPVVDYFTGLGGLTACWQMDYTATGQQLIAWGNESFTVEHCELEGGCEFALVFELAEGMITRLVVIEDLASFVRGSDQRPMPHGGSSSIRYLGASACKTIAMNLGRRSATSADPGCATRSRARAASSRGSRRGGRRTRLL